MCYLSPLLPLLERLFGVKGHDCCLSCLAFRNDCCRVLLGDLFFEGWLRHVLCVVYNFSRFRLFCAGSGLTVQLCVGKNVLPVLDHVGVEENYLFVVCWCYLVLTM